MQVKECISLNENKNQKTLIIQIASMLTTVPFQGWNIKNTCKIQETII